MVKKQIVNTAFVKTVAIVVLIAILSFLIAYLYAWKISFKNLCSGYCSLAGYKNYIVKDFTCKCLNKANSLQEHKSFFSGSNTKLNQPFYEL